VRLENVNRLRLQALDVEAVPRVEPGGGGGGPGAVDKTAINILQQLEPPRKSRSA
jgi:hypothetical protein